MFSLQKKSKKSIFSILSHFLLKKIQPQFILHIGWQIFRDALKIKLKI